MSFSHSSRSLSRGCNSDSSVSSERRWRRRRRSPSLEKRREDRGLIRETRPPMVTNANKPPMKCPRPSAQRFLPAARPSSAINLPAALALEISAARCNHLTNPGSISAAALGLCQGVNPHLLTLAAKTIAGANAVANGQAAAPLRNPAEVANAMRGMLFPGGPRPQNAAPPIKELLQRMVRPAKGLGKSVAGPPSHNVLPARAPLIKLAPVLMPGSRMELIRIDSGATATPSLSQTSGKPAFQNPRSAFQNPRSMRSDSSASKAEVFEIPLARPHNDAHVAPLCSFNPTSDDCRSQDIAIKNAQKLVDLAASMARNGESASVRRVPSRSRSPCDNSRRFNSRGKSSQLSASSRRSPSRSVHGRREKTGDDDWDRSDGWKLPSSDHGRENHAGWNGGSWQNRDHRK